MADYTDGAELLPAERESLSKLARFYRRQERRPYNSPTRKRYRKALRMARRRAGVFKVVHSKTSSICSARPSNSYSQFERLIRRDACRGF